MGTYNRVTWRMQHLHLNDRHELYLDFVDVGRDVGTAIRRLYGYDLVVNHE